MTTYRVLATPKYGKWWSDSQHEFKEEFTEYGFIEKISGKTLRNQFKNVQFELYCLKIVFSLFLNLKKVKFRINLVVLWVIYGVELME